MNIDFPTTFQVSRLHPWQSYAYGVSEAVWDGAGLPDPRPGQCGSWELRVLTCVLFWSGQLETGKEISFQVGDGDAPPRADGEEAEETAEREELLTRGEAIGALR